MAEKLGERTLIPTAQAGCFLLTEFADARLVDCRNADPMGENLTIWTYDWVPEGPRGFVRDLRLRWGAEEAGLSYDVDTVPFEDRPISHLDRQPFGQVPFLTDGEITIFESGACLLHLARKSDILMPSNASGEA
jgi:glutathione S-transferase